MCAVACAPIAFISLTRVCVWVCAPDYFNVMYTVIARLHTNTFVDLLFSLWRNNRRITSTCMRFNSMPHDLYIIFIMHPLASALLYVAQWNFIHFLYFFFTFIHIRSVFGWHNLFDTKDQKTVANGYVFCCCCFSTSNTQSNKKKSIALYTISFATYVSMIWSNGKCLNLV